MRQYTDFQNIGRHLNLQFIAIESKKIIFDILFMDIIMDDMNGMTCARMIRQQDKLVNIVFLTSSTDYVYEGYEVNAAAYLLKPLDGQ